MREYIDVQHVTHEAVLLVPMEQHDRLGSRWCTCGHADSLVILD